MSIYSGDENGLTSALAELRAGGVIGLPTETVYGLAGDGLNEHAVTKIFEVKGRPRFDPLILHVSMEYAVGRLARINDDAERLMRSFWPGPLTLVLPRSSLVPDIVTAGLDTVAIRCPRHRLTQELLRRFDGPLAAPSANRFGRISPTSAADVREELGDSIRVILDGGPCEIGVESTIVMPREDGCFMLRRGGVSPEDMEKVLGNTPIPAKAQPGVMAPGMLPQHYAPGKKLYLLEEKLTGDARLTPDMGCLYWSCVKGEPHRTLTPTGDLSEAATRLFKMLRELDASPAETLICEPVPPVGLGLAIRDRLERASSGKATWRDGEWKFYPREI